MSKGASKVSRSPRIWLSDTWALEIAALILSVASLIAIMILLSVYDGKPQFSFGFINLNTIIAILAAAFRIGFMVPVGEALAQWKWLWFSKQARPLGDFDSIDDASRGSRGSLMLLWETRGMSLTAIGAWVAIFSLATEPFIQQLVTYRDTIVFEDSPLVTIPYAQRWLGADDVVADPDVSSSNLNGTDAGLTTHISGYATVSDIQLDQSVQAAVQFGLNSDAAAVAAQLPAACPSGNCTWPSFVSLGVCSKCIDLSSELKSSLKTDWPMGWFAPRQNSGNMAQGPQNLTQYYLPNGLSINNRRQNYGYHASSAVATTLANLRPSTSIHFKGSTTLLFSSTILRVPDSAYPVNAIWPEPAVIEAAECGIYLCAKIYKSRVESGVLIEDSEEVATTRDPDSYAPFVGSCGGPCGTLDFENSTAVDSLFSNTTYLKRSDLSIQVPSGFVTSNHIQSVNVSQKGIDGLSSYVYSLFDDSFFNNASVSVIKMSPCLDADGNEITCGILRNISGMAAGPSGNPGAPETATLFSPAVMEQIWGTPNLKATFQNLASSITNEMRKNNVDGNDSSQPLNISGQLGRVRTVLKVRWQWITLPALLLLVSALFLLMTMIESTRTATPLWKGSALAVLYHGLEAKVRSTLEHWDLPSQMSEASEDVKVRLRRDAMDDVLLLRTGPDKTLSMPLMRLSEAQRPTTPDPHDDTDDDSSQIPLAAVQHRPGEEE